MEPIVKDKRQRRSEGVTQRSPLSKTTGEGEARV